MCKFHKFEGEWKCAGLDFLCSFCSPLPPFPHTFTLRLSVKTLSLSLCLSMLCISFGCVSTPEKEPTSTPTPVPKRIPTPTPTKIPTPHPTPTPIRAPVPHPTPTPHPTPIDKIMSKVVTFSILLLGCLMLFKSDTLIFCLSLSLLLSPFCFEQLLDSLLVMNVCGVG